MQVGNGAEDFEAAKQLLQDWVQFQLAWAFVDPSTQTSPGTQVVVQAKPIPLLPLWVACPLRIMCALCQAARWPWRHAMLHVANCLSASPRHICLSARSD